MKKADIIFSHETRDNFLKRCMKDANQEIVNKCARKAKNTEEFIDLYLACDEEIGTQFHAELMKRERPNLVWKTIRGIFGDRQFKTEADAGSVKVGNENFSVLIPNGYGDGFTRVAIFSKEEFLAECYMNFLTLISGTNISIYSYDCGDEVCKVINGVFAVYAKDGFVAFVKKAD